MLFRVIVSLCLVASALGGPPLMVPDDPSRLYLKQDYQNEVENPILAMPRYRLPVDFKPYSYKIKIVPILPPHNTAYADFDAPGDVEILVECLNPTNQITLNKRNITVQNATITVLETNTNRPIVVASTTEVPQEEFYILNLGESLTNGTNYTIYMRFLGNVADDVFGLYRAEYTDETGNQFWLATTQMETTGFRQMTPSFDEPSFKATFQVSVGYNATIFNTLTNALGKNTTMDDDVNGLLPPQFSWDIYEPTVKMSSYLFALVVSNFECTPTFNTTLIGNKPVGICGPPHLMQKGGGVYGAVKSDQILAAFEAELGIEYQEKKMQSVGVPRNYFRFGAMENYGLNIYRDNLLLEYGKQSTEATRYSVTSILSHELAHQWFGNLVTTAFWTHIWLNEGFATYMAFIGVDRVLPGMYDDVATGLIDATQSAMAFDVTANSHPVINEPKNLSEISSLQYFDGISYDKGASLLRMMEHFLGRANLFNGIKGHLQNKKFDNAFQDDLFEQLQANAPNGSMPANLTIKEVMDTWTLQVGFPLVRVSKASPTSAYISQERYTLNNVDSDRVLDEDELWEVPVSVVTASNPDFAGHSPNAAFWIPRNVILKTIDVNTNEWLMVNPEGYGYYRVLYEPSLLRMIQNQLDTNHTVISPAAKSKLLEDYVTFAKHGYAPLEAALDNMRFIGDEPHHLVWKIVLSFLSPLSTRLSGTNNASAEVKAFLEPRIGKVLGSANLGWTEAPEERGVYTILRPRLLDWACFIDHPDCAKTANAYAQTWNATTGSEAIPLNLRSVVVCAAVARNGENIFNLTLNEYVARLTRPSEYDSNQASLLAAGMACTQDAEKQDWLLTNIIEPDVLDDVHRGTVLTTMAGNSGSRSKVYEFVRNRWEELVGEGPTYNTALLINTLNTIRNYQNDPEDKAAHLELVEEIRAVSPELFAVIQNSLTSITNTIDSNIAWAASELPIYKSWFANNA